MPWSAGEYLERRVDAWSSTQVETIPTSRSWCRHTKVGRWQKMSVHFWGFWSCSGSWHVYIRKLEKLYSKNIFVCYSWGSSHDSTEFAVVQWLAVFPNPRFIAHLKETCFEEFRGSRCRNVAHNQCESPQFGQPRRVARIGWPTTIRRPC